jgi:hypothetical protein
MFSLHKRHLTGCWIFTILAAAMAYCTHGAADEPSVAPEDAGRVKRLEKMKLSAAQFKIYPAADRAHPFTLVEAPVMRWTNPENLAKDGTIFLWTGGGRPQAILGLFTYDDDHYSHEWQSLAEGPLAAERGHEIEWSPAESGLQFAPVKGAEEPAPTAAGRLRQMKALAPKFSSTFVGFTENQRSQELRLLPQPLYRYETGDSRQVLDGALFAFAQGTDPQSLLALEARADNGAPRWQFAFVRMASGALTGRYENQEVYSVPKYNFQERDPRRPYLLLARQPAPEQ